MAFVDDQSNQNSSGNSVTSSPLGGAQAPAQDTQQPQGGSATPSTIQSSQPSQSVSSPQTTSKSGKASSGMFTNIRKYVQKNKPQAAKIAQASADSVRQANEATKAAQQQALSQVGAQANQSGLSDTQARIGELERFTREEANIQGDLQPAQQPAQQPTVQQEPEKYLVKKVSRANALGGRDTKYKYIENPEYNQPESNISSQQTVIGDMKESTGVSQGRSIKTSPDIGTTRTDSEGNTMYYAGTGSSSGYTDMLKRIAGEEVPDRKFHTHDMKQYWLTEDQFNNLYPDGYTPPSTTDVKRTGRTPEESSAMIDESRFQDIINAQYGGPASLSEMSNVYNELSSKAREGSRVGDLTKTDTGRGQLLKEMFSKGNRQYTQGQQQLDNLLMGQDESAVRDVIESGRNIGAFQDIINQTSQDARGIIDEARGNVDATREQARERFEALAGLRQGQVDTRLDDVVENWDKLPDHYKKIFSSGSPELSALEAATLGMTGDDRLFDTVSTYGVDNLFGGVEADKTKLISKDEQANLARLQELSNLAKTGENKLYDIGDYFDESKAGSQSAFDALNLDNFADKLAERERNFKREASKVDTATGHKKVSRGNWRGKKTKHYYASARDSLMNQLEAQRDKGIQKIMQQRPELSKAEAAQIADKLQIGYDRGKKVERLQTKPELLKSISTLDTALGDLGIEAKDLKNLDFSNMMKSESRQNYDDFAKTLETGLGAAKTAGLASLGGSALAGLAATGFGAPAALSMMNPTVLGAALALNMATGQELPDWAEELGRLPGNTISEAGRGYENIMNTGSEVAQGLEDKLNSIANIGGVGLGTPIGAMGDLVNNLGDLGGNVAREIGSFVSGLGGIDTKSMNKFGSATAQRIADEKLKAQLEGKQRQLGVDNIARVVDNDQTRLRTDALMDMLRNLDKTNY